MKNLMECNTLRRLDVISKILKSNGNYKIICIDVDDVIFDTDTVVQKLLEEIDYRATKKYREKISHETSEERELLEESFNILDAILEETIYIDYDEEKEKITRKSYKTIDYNHVYQEENLVSNAIQFVRDILDSRQENEFVIFLSHRNPEREGLIKTKILYKLFPDVDVIETLPFHIERGSKKMNSKALWMKQIYNLKDLRNVYLIDNSRTNCKDFRKHGGNFARYLPEGFNCESTLADHMSKLTSLDPYMLRFALSFIDYCRNNPEYLKTVDKSSKVKKL